jgi:hypothetical protein
MFITVFASVFDIFNKESCEWHIKVEEMRLDAFILTNLMDGW